jgi:hypothetical protein
LKNYCRCWICCLSCRPPWGKTNHTEKTKKKSENDKQPQTLVNLSIGTDTIGADCWFWPPVCAIAAFWMARAHSLKE